MPYVIPETDWCASVGDVVFYGSPSRRIVVGCREWHGAQYDELVNWIRSNLEVVEV